MAFPTVAASTFYATTSLVTSHVFNRPGASSSGDLILCLNKAYNEYMDPPGGAGWVEFLDAGGTGTGKYKHYYLVDGGSEPASWTFTTATARRAACAMLRISGWGGTFSTDVDVADAVNSSDPTPNPPAITAGWGSDDNLFINWLGRWLNNDATISSGPTGYTYIGGAGDTGSSGASTDAWYRQLAAASEAEGEITLSDSDAVLVTSMVIKPAAAAAPASYIHPNRRAMRTLLTQ